MAALPRSPSARAAVAAATTRQHVTSRAPLDALTIGYDRAFAVLAAVATAGALIALIFLRPATREGTAPALTGATTV